MEQCKELQQQARAEYVDVLMYEMSAAIDKTTPPFPSLDKIKELTEHAKVCIDCSEFLENELMRPLQASEQKTPWEGSARA